MDGFLLYSRPQQPAKFIQFFFCYKKMHLVKAICSVYDFYIAIVKVCAVKFKVTRKTL